MSLQPPPAPLRHDSSVESLEQPDEAETRQDFVMVNGKPIVEPRGGFPFAG